VWACAGAEADGTSQEQAAAEAEGGIALMCRKYLVTWEADGQTVETEHSFMFPREEEALALPACTCWMADGSIAGEALWAAFCERIRPLIREVSAGRIVVEVF
jgi:hypothetical protein